MPLFVTGLIAGSTRLGLGLAVGSALGALAYCALFLALSLLTRRPVLLGLLYVLIWEGLLGNLLAGTRVLSIQQYVVAVADRVSGSSTYCHGERLGPGGGRARAAVHRRRHLLAIDRLRSFTLAGETS